MGLTPQTQMASAQAVTIDEGVDRGNRLPIFLQPKLFPLCLHDAAEASPWSFRDFGVHAPRLVKQIGVDELDHDGFPGRLDALQVSSFHAQG